MDVIDLKRALKRLYAPPAERVEVVDVPALPFLRIDGVVTEGDEPSSSPLFQQQVGALYSVAYTLKFMLKKRPSDPIDYPVMPLEGLWWTESGNFTVPLREPWRYILLITVPEIITPALLAEAQALAAKKDNPVVNDVRLETFAEGLAVQTMHVGPYADEPATIALLHRYAEEHGYTLRGKHHEIYLGDPRRCAPERLKTILRQPVETKTT